MRRYKGNPTPDWLALAVLLALVQGLLIALIQRLFY